MDNKGSMTTDWAKCDLVEKVPDRMGGVLVFKDTRLAVSQLFGVLRDGGTIHDFLEWFDTVVNESDVKAVLDFLEADLTREWAGVEAAFVAEQQTIYGRTSP